MRDPLIDIEVQTGNGDETVTLYFASTTDGDGVILVDAGLERTLSDLEARDMLSEKSFADAFTQARARLAPPKDETFK